MKKSLLLALLSSVGVFAHGGFGHGISHSSHVSHSSSHVSSHSSGTHSSGFHSTSHPTVHTSSYHSSSVSHESPYHPTGNIRTSSVEYHPLHRYYYYPIMNHNTKTMDTIKGKTSEEVQTKVNSYVQKNDVNWVGVGCLITLIAVVVGYSLWNSREKK